MIIQLGCFCEAKMKQYVLHVVICKVPMNVITAVQKIIFSLQ